MNEQEFDYIVEVMELKGKGLTAVKDVIVNGLERREAIRRRRITIAVFNSRMREFKKLANKMKSSAF